MNDHWKSMAGYPNFEVNDDGLVRSRITHKIYEKWDNVKPVSDETV